MRNTKKNSNYRTLIVNIYFMQLNFPILCSCVSWVEIKLGYVFCWLEIQTNGPTSNIPYQRCVQWLHEYSMVCLPTLRHDSISRAQWEASFRQIINYVHIIKVLCQASLGFSCDGGIWQPSSACRWLKLERISLSWL